MGSFVSNFFLLNKYLSKSYYVGINNRIRHPYSCAQGTYMPTSNKGYILQVLELQFFIWNWNKHKKCFNSLCAPQRPQVESNYIVCALALQVEKKKTDSGSPAPLRLWCSLRNNATLENESYYFYNNWHLSIPYFSPRLRFLLSSSRELALTDPKTIANSYYPREKI